MSIVQWNPWKEFDDVFGRAVRTPSEHLSGSEWLPAVDITETDAAYQIQLEIPGVPASEISATVAPSSIRSANRGALDRALCS